MICVVALWGRKFADLYLNYALPSHLGCGNIESLEPADQYIIFTDKQTYLYLKNKQIIKHLQSITKVIWKISFKKKLDWNDMTEFHKHALRESTKSGQGCVFLGPDFIISQNAIRIIKENARAHIKLILVPGIRANLCKISKILQNFVQGNILNIKNTQLAKIAYRNLHPITKCQFLNSKRFTYWPSNIIQKDPYSGNLVIQSLHIHPIYVKIDSCSDINFIESIDGALLQKFFGLKKNIYQIENSEDMILVELSERNKTIAEPSVQNKFNKYTFYKFCFEHTLPIHRWIFQKPYILQFTKKATKNDLIKIGKLFYFLLLQKKFAQILKIMFPNFKNKQILKLSEYKNIKKLKSNVLIKKTNFTVSKKNIFDYIVVKNEKFFFPRTIVYSNNPVHFSQKQLHTSRKNRKANYFLKFGNNDEIKKILLALFTKKQIIEKISLISTKSNVIQNQNSFRKCILFRIFKNIFFSEKIFVFPKRFQFTKHTLKKFSINLAKSIIGIKIVFP